MYRDKTRDEERFAETSWKHAKVTMADVKAQGSGAAWRPPAVADGDTPGLTVALNRNWKSGFYGC